jgi:hypothetical protein
MTRLERSSWTEEMIGIKNSGGISALFDNYFKTNMRITDKEYDHICEIATDEEMEVLAQERLSFSEKRRLMVFLKRHVYEKVEESVS